VAFTFHYARGAAARRRSPRRSHRRRHPPRQGLGVRAAPGTDRLYFRFGAPIATTPWAGRAGDPAALAECRDVVKAEVEAQIAYLRALRDGDPQRALLPRVGHTVRSILPL
jgi:hypothetical protein